MFAVLILHSHLDASAQLRFDSWTTENGLPQNSVNDILQTRDGYLWLATHGGLVRFDGIRFVIFDRSVEGIESQRIRALHEDRRGALWAATEDGMLVRYQDGRFRTYTSRDGLPQATGTRIEEDEAGVLWVTWVGTVTRFDGQRFVNLTASDFEPAVSPPPDPWYLDAWWSQAASGVHILSKGRVLDRFLGRELPKVVTGMNVDRGGNLWIRTRGRGVLRATDGDVEQYTVREGLPTNSPEGMFYAGAAGDIWYAVPFTDNVYRLRQGKQERVRIPGLRGASGLRAVYVDQEGSTWLGTTGAGLHRVQAPLFTMYREANGVPLSGAYSVLQDRTGAVWIAHGDLTRYTDGSFATFYRARRPGGKVACLYEAKSGRLWVGTVDGVRYIQDGQPHTFKDTSGFLNGIIRAILEDRLGALWFATASGLVKLSDGRFTRYTTDDGLPDDRITALFQDSSDALWIGTFRGVTRLSNGVFTAITEKDGFIGNQVRAFHEDADGVIWVGTYDGGLYRFAADRLTRYTRRDGLHDNGVFQILEDGGGYFWIGSNTGIYRISRRELNAFAEGRRAAVTSLAFGTRDGLATLEVNGGNQPSGLTAADGSLWFPTMGGVAVVHPAALQTDGPPPQTIIEEVLVAGSPLSVVPQDVRVDPRAVLEIRYTAPTFIKPQQVRFRYRLVGFADDWVSAGDRRSASFHSIPPGEYTFVVSASSHLGVWDPVGHSLRVVVLPSFWGTAWFRTLIGTAVVMLFVAVHVARVRRLRRDELRRRVYLQELIDSQERERRRISNDLHDSMGYDLAIVRRHAREGLGLNEVNDRARREFQDILSTADRIETEMKAIAYALRPYHLDKVGLTRSIEELVLDMDAASDVELHADLVNVDGLFPQDSEIHIYRLVQECLSNIVKHATARMARVTVARSRMHVEIRIEDDGAGLGTDASRGPASESDGFGLVGISERVQLLGGVVEFNSNQRDGTTIVVRLWTEEAARE